MHIRYEAQCDAKRANVVNHLSRIGGVKREVAELVVDPCIPSKHTLGYRNKLEFASAFNEAGKFVLGFHQHSNVNNTNSPKKRSTNKSPLIPIPKTCLLGVRGIEKAPGALRGALAYIQGTSSLNIFRVGVRHSTRTKETEIALWSTPSSFPRKIAADTLSSALRCTSIVRVIADPGKARKIKKVEALYGNGCWGEQLMDTYYRVSAPSFFQVNTIQAEKMIKLVIDGLNIDETSVVADLYCGAGTFTLPLAQHCKYIYAVESSASSVRDLRRNMKHIQYHNIEIIGGDSARELPTLGKLDALVVDPPRAGLAKGVTESIAASGAQCVAYVSCDPATWARDIARFKTAGYTLLKATPVDLFPQSYHIETVSILTRNK